ncbi:MAG: DUF4815 domain-containing protein, partial [Pelagibacteraceae bacterium]
MPRITFQFVVPTENSRSPFEFLGRSFDSTQNSNLSILASDESINLDYSIYLGRIDRLYLTKQKSFQVVQGTPEETPEPPVPIDNAMEVAVITYPPYLTDVKDAKVSLLDHKRYRMQDIALLEKRIANLEYYTQLSLLETNTANLEIKDSDG